MTEAALYYDHHVFFCTNRRPDGHKIGCCASKGSEELRNYMKARTKELGLEGKIGFSQEEDNAPKTEVTRINGAGCLGRCDLGPVVVIYPEAVWYSPKNKADIDEILTVHLQQGGRVTRLLLPAPVRG